MKISTYLEEMCTNPYISLFFHDGRVDVLDSDGEYVDYICYQEDFETDDELIREVAEFAREPLNKSPSFSAERENRRLPLGSSDSVGK